MQMIEEFPEPLEEGLPRSACCAEPLRLNQQKTVLQRNRRTRFSSGRSRIESRYLLLYKEKILLVEIMPEGSASMWRMAIVGLTTAALGVKIGFELHKRRSEKDQGGLKKVR